MRKISKNKIINFTLLYSLFGAPATSLTDANMFCESSREFITTYEFLKSEDQFFRSADLSVATSKKVAEGCKGSAARFIKTVKALAKTELSTADILSAAEQSALKTDATSEAFLKIFTRLYASDDFDFDLNTSLKMARSLSVDFKGEADVALKDFEEVSKFCLKTEGLNFGKVKCAELAQALAITSEKHHLSVSDAFSAGFSYLISEKGPSMNAVEAMKQAQELVLIHPEAVNNFKVAFDYAVSKKGLEAPKADAIKFAKLMASQTANNSDLKSPADSNARVK